MDLLAQSGQLSPGPGGKGLRQRYRRCLDDFAKLFDRII